MERTRVKSSTVLSVGYDPLEQVLVVEFKRGSLYHYLGVSVSDFESFMAAPSKGRFLHYRIKPRYQYRRVR